MKCNILFSNYNIENQIMNSRSIYVILAWKNSINIPLLPLLPLVFVTFRLSCKKPTVASQRILNPSPNLTLLILGNVLVVCFTVLIGEGCPVFGEKSKFNCRKLKIQIRYTT
jgi:hypothetical protein